MAGVGIVRLRMAWRIWVALFLPYFVVTVVGLLSVQRPLALQVVGVGAVVVFVALYLPPVWRGVFRPDDVPDPRVRIAACAVIALAGVAVFGPSWGGLVTFTAFFAGGTLRRAFSGLAVVLGVTVPGTALLAVTGGLETLFWGPYATLVGLTSIAFVWVVESYRHVERAHGELARLAVADERLRFARDLHDLLGHSLSLIALKTELAGHLIERDPVRAKSEIDDVQAATREALAEVRRAVAGYRGSVDLGTELHRAGEALRAAGVEVAVETPGGTLPPEVDELLAWTVREGSTNIVRHARAARASIRVHADDEGVGVEIVDDGAGAGAVDGHRADGGGNGLDGLAERVAAAQGDLAAGATDGGGFRLRVRVPR